jgi:hypothetical protein
MASFADYINSDYLPGQVRRATYGDASPKDILEYTLRKKLKFQPKSNIAGKYLEEFLGLTTNPDGFAQQAFQLPAEFNAFSKMGQYAG